MRPGPRETLWRDARLTAQQEGRVTAQPEHEMRERRFDDLRNDYVAFTTACHRATARYAGNAGNY